MTSKELTPTITFDDVISGKNNGRSVLDALSKQYLLGDDADNIKKNFANWGTRSNGELVLLDYSR